MSDADGIDRGVANRGTPVPATRVPAHRPVGAAKFPFGRVGETPFAIIKETAAVENWKEAARGVVNETLDTKAPTFEEAEQHFKRRLKHLPERERGDFARKLFDMTRKRFYGLEHRNPSFDYTREQLANLEKRAAPIQGTQIDHLAELKGSRVAGVDIPANPERALDPWDLAFVDEKQHRQKWRGPEKRRPIPSDRYTSSGRSTLTERGTGAPGAAEQIRGGTGHVPEEKTPGGGSRALPAAKRAVPKIAAPRQSVVPPSEPGIAKRIGTHLMASFRAIAPTLVSLAFQIILGELIARWQQAIDERRMNKDWSTRILPHVDAYLKSPELPRFAGEMVAQYPVGWLYLQIRYAVGFRQTFSSPTYDGMSFLDASLTKYPLADSCQQVGSGPSIDLITYSCSAAVQAVNLGEQLAAEIGDIVDTARNIARSRSRGPWRTISAYLLGTGIDSLTMAQKWTIAAAPYMVKRHLNEFVTDFNRVLGEVLYVERLDPAWEKEIIDESKPPLARVLEILDLEAFRNIQ